MPEISEFEQKRLDNIEANRQLLISLGLDEPMIDKPPPRIRSRPNKDSTPTQRKRKFDNLTPTDAAGEGSARRSGRERKQSKLFELEVLTKDQKAPSRVNRDQDRDEDEDGNENGNLDDFVVDDDVSVNRNLPARLNGPRSHDPKTFGPIPGIEIGHRWDSRMRASQDAVHAPVVAGIAGSSSEGAFSVCVSGGYEDDVDEGDTFTYSGSGGRDLRGNETKKKNLRTAPQSFDQNFDHPLNSALKKSSETKLPIRCIRGFKGKSIFAPPVGYIYSGLYWVESAYMERGTTGFMMCKFRFRRLPDQAPLPTFDPEEKKKAQSRAKPKPESTEEDQDLRLEGEGGGEASTSTISSSGPQSRPQRSVLKNKNDSSINRRYSGRISGKNVDYEEKLYLGEEEEEEEKGKGRKDDGGLVGNVETLLEEVKDGKEEIVLQKEDQIELEVEGKL